MTLQPTLEKVHFLGIDGGGTKTVFRLVSESGDVLNSVTKGSANPNDIGMDSACKVLKEGITEVCKGIPFSCVSAFAGISGGGLTGSNALILEKFFAEFGFFAFENGSDVENLISLCDAEKKILVIMGTGFIVYAINGEERKRIGGWGQFFDDGGSGYTLGRDAISAVLCALDGSGEKTMLTELFEKRTGESAEAHLAKFYEGGKKYIAGFSDLVFSAARLGDSVALEILRKNAEYVARRINAAADFIGSENGEDIPVMISGGISNEGEILFPLIKARLGKGISAPKRITAEPVEGAIKRAVTVFETKRRTEDA